MTRFCLALYNLGWQIALPILGKNPRLKEGYADRILQGRPCRPADIWIQAASAGEAYLAASLTRALAFRSHIRILLSTNTRQGMDILEKETASCCNDPVAASISLRFFPFDKPSLMKNAVEQLAPRVMVLLETELWPGLLSALRSHNCRILILNARMTPRSLKRYQMFPGLWNRLAPDRVLAVSREDAARYNKLFGDKTAGVMPNIKFDRLRLENSSRNAGQGGNLPVTLPQDTPFLVLGSIREEEEALAEKMFRRIKARFPALVTGLFPRHLHRLGAWQQRLDRIGVQWVLRSRLGSRPATPGMVVLWDRFGELNAGYAHATAVFIGGSLAPLGGQNFLEPLMYGVVPVIGPSWENFAWVGRRILSRGLVCRTRNWREAADRLIRQIEAPPSPEEVREAADAYIKTHQGGTSQACRLIFDMLDDD
ncbi:MAG: glycosyltransferase N-terminal domain-containing protein [Desulfosalsimonadaceae bacterium]